MPARVHLRGYADQTFIPLRQNDNPSFYNRGTGDDTERSWGTQPSDSAVRTIQLRRRMNLELQMCTRLGAISFPRDEIGELAAAFNRMTEQLAEQRDRAIQAERVAAWRELARRLAHELKNPLFPLQITIENLRKARDLSESEFDEVFEESTGTLLAELGNLKTIIGRFSDFAKMPPPSFEPVDVNQIVRNVMKLYDAQFKTEPRVEGGSK